MRSNGGAFKPLRHFQSAVLSDLRLSHASDQSASTRPATGSERT